MCHNGGNFGVLPSEVGETNLRLGLRGDCHAELQPATKRSGGEERQGSSSLLLIVGHRDHCWESSKEQGQIRRVSCCGVGITTCKGAVGRWRGLRCDGRNLQRPFVPVSCQGPRLDRGPSRHLDGQESSQSSLSGRSQVRCTCIEAHMRVQAQKRCACM